MSSSAIPAWLLFVGSTAVALVFAVGLVALLILGRQVPQELWVLVGVIATAYFGSGPFSVAHQSVSATNRALIDTVNHAIATLREGMTSLQVAISEAKHGTGTSSTSPGAETTGTRLG